MQIYLKLGLLLLDKCSRLSGAQMHGLPHGRWGDNRQGTLSCIKLMLFVKMDYDGEGREYVWDFSREWTWFFDDFGRFPYNITKYEAI